MRSGFAAVMVVAAVGAACGTSGSAADDAAADAGPPAPIDAARDAAVMDPPDAGAHDGRDAAITDTLLPTDAGPVLVWREHAPGPEALDRHALFGHVTLEGAWLYTAGGARSDGAGTELSSRILRAPIDGAGAPGPWAPVGALPSARAASSVTRVGAHVVLTGGQLDDARGGVATAEVLVLALDARGAVTTATAAALPSGRFHHASAGIGRRVFVGGGYGAGAEILDDVLTTTVGADGVLGPWRPAGQLPRPITLAAMITIGGRLFLVGGSEAEHTFDGVASAEILADGTLGPWRPEALLPESLTTPALFTHDGWLYAVGGRRGGHHAPAAISRAVLRARVGERGVLSPWSEVTDPLPGARHHLAHVALIDGRAFLYGGRSAADRSTDSVWSSALP